MEDMDLRFRIYLLLSCWFFFAIEHAEGARVKVAFLDGAPVYHLTVFRSIYPDDVDRALILRAFDRQGYTLPRHFTDEAVQRVIDKDFGGDKGRLIDWLKRNGETIRDFREFITEEIILRAMYWRETQRGKEGRPPVSEAAWLASLRKGAYIQILTKEISDRR
jgi:hypothetical protein